MIIWLDQYYYHRLDTWKNSIQESGETLLQIKARTKYMEIILGEIVLNTQMKMYQEVY